MDADAVVNFEADGLLDANVSTGVAFDVESVVLESRLAGTKIALVTVGVEVVSME